jgi:MFS family permease
MTLSYRWVIIGAGALMTCVALGAMFSLAIFLEPMSAATGWSRAGISSAMTVNFLILGLGNFGWGAASDRFGTRIVVLIGAVLLGLDLTIASRATSLLEFQLTYGIGLRGAAATPAAGVSRSIKGKRTGEGVVPAPTTACGKTAPGRHRTSTTLRP